MQAARAGHYRERVFRVFVSSTFSDFVHERNVLQEGAFQRLQDYCRSRGAEFQAVDLRWGVSDEAGRDQQTVQICLEELERCQRISPRPNFLVLMGNRYGWRPLPPVIVAEEFEELIPQMTATEQECLLWHATSDNNEAGWYRHDDNAVPAAYVLQPRSGPFLNDAIWMKEEAKARELLLAVVDRVWTPDDSRRTKYVASATHLEILHGALRAADAESHVFCYFRDFETPLDESDVQTHKYIDVLPSGEADRDAGRRLRWLRHRLQKKFALAGHVYRYAAPSVHDIPESVLQRLDQRIEADLKRVIDRELQQLDDVAAHGDQEPAAHFKTGEAARRHFRGRDDELKQIARYLADSTPHPLIVTGAPGSGKTAMMAQAAWLARQSSGAVLIERYLGTSPASSQLRGLLQSVCTEIAAAYHDESPLPSEERELVLDFRNRLRSATPQQPLIIFLDALDQVATRTRMGLLDWLPWQIPPHVKLVVSVLQTGDTLPPVAFGIPPNSLLKLSALPPADGRMLLDDWLLDAGRQLQPAQREVVISRFQSSGLPLYLRFAFEQARHWTSWQPLPGEPGGPEPLPADVTGMVQHLLSSLERESRHGPVLVNRALGYLAASRHGLTESELLEILSADEVVLANFRERSPRSPHVERLPPIVWARLHGDLAPYMVRRQADETSVLMFYHGQLTVAIRERCLRDCAADIHRRLARYFAGQTATASQPYHYVDADGRWTVNHRKLSELPYHQARAGLALELTRTLLDLNYFSGKVRGGRVFEIPEDLDASVEQQSCLPRAVGMVKIVSEALRSNVQFLAKHPEALLQCLWNHCWWYDCDGVAEHYQMPPAGHLGRDGIRISALVEGWLRQDGAADGSRCWCRSLRPPPVRLQSSQSAVFAGHTGTVLCGDVTVSGHRVVSGSSDGTLRVWESATGEELYAIEIGDSEVVAVAISPDQRLIAAATRAGDFCIVELAMGTTLVRCETASELRCLAWLPNNQWLFTGNAAGSLSVWDAVQGRELQRLASGTASVGAIHLAWSPHLGVGAACLTDRTVRVIVMQRDNSGALALKEHGVYRSQFTNGLPRHVQFGADASRLLVVYDDTRVEELDLRTWQLHREHVGNRDRMERVAISPNFQQIAAAREGGLVWLWDTQSRRIIESFEFHADTVNHLQFSSDGEKLLTGSRDGSLRFSPLGSASDSAFLRSHQAVLTAVEFSPDGSCVATGAGDGSCTLWDSSTGRLLMELPVQRKPVMCVSAQSRTAAAFQMPRSRVWDVLTGASAPGFNPQLAGRAVWSLAFSPDSRRLAAGSFRMVRLWDTRNGAEIGCVGVEGGCIWQLALFPDGQRLAGALDDESVRVWDVRAGVELQRFDHSMSAVQSLAVSADGVSLTSVGGDGVVRHWELRTGKLTPLTGQPSSSPVWEMRAHQDCFAIVNAAHGEPVAYFPSLARRIARNRPQPWVPHPSGLKWAGGFGRYLALVQLEISVPLVERSPN